MFKKTRTKIENGIDSLNSNTFSMRSEYKYDKNINLILLQTMILQFNEISLLKEDREDKSVESIARSISAVLKSCS